MKQKTISDGICRDAASTSTKTAPVPIIIFGAALKKDGSPTPALRDRVKAALAFGRHHKNVLYIPTGNVPQKGVTEAEVMACLLLKEGVSATEIVVEKTATDTFDSIVACTKILKKQSLSNTRIALATSPYHMPRCTLLMRLAGWKVHQVPFPYKNLTRTNLFHKILIIGHEILASGWDALLVLAWRIVR